jgi:hypothetical protein
LNSTLNFQKNGILNFHIWSKIVEKKFGQFGQNLTKRGQKLEKVSQPRGLSFHSNKYDFLKLDLICKNRSEPDFLIWPPIFL